MKSFSKLIFLFVVFAITTQVNAQSFAVKAGMNLSNMVVKESDSTLSNDYKSNIGFNFGGTIEIPMVNNFSLEPGIFVSTKGFHEEISEDFFGIKYSMKMNMNLYYIDIPINGKYTFNMNNFKIYGLLGPYLGIGLTGTYKQESTAMNQTQTEEKTVVFDSKNEEFHLNRFDYGFQIGAGVEVQSFLFAITYNYGLGNILPNTENNSTATHRILGFSVGYRL